MQFNIAKEVMEKKKSSKTFFKTLSMLSGLSQEDINKDLKEKEMILNWIVKKDIRDINEIGILMTEYYTDKQKLLKRVKGG